MTSLPSNKWLTAVNERFRAEDIPPTQRPWLAWREYAIETQASFELRDPAVQRIFAWFREHTKAGSMSVGPISRAAYFFDASFWPLEIPVFFGTAALDLFSALPTMPPRTKLEVGRDAQALRELTSSFASALDCALSVDDLQRSSPTGLAAEFLHSGYRELTACAAMLLGHRPSAKVTHTATFVVENFGKWLLATRTPLDEKTAKRKYGHQIDLILQDCGPYLPAGEGPRLLKLAQQLPPVEDRYKKAEPDSREKWECYRDAQIIAAALLRVETARDSVLTVRVREG